MFKYGFYEYDLYLLLLLFFWTLSASYMTKKKHLFIVTTVPSRWWLGVEQQIQFLEKNKYNIQNKYVNWDTLWITYWYLPDACETGLLSTDNCTWKTLTLEHNNYRLTLPIFHTSPLTKGTFQETLHNLNF